MTIPTSDQTLQSVTSKKTVLKSLLKISYLLIGLIISACQFRDSNTINSFLEIDTAKIHYETTGEGEPLLFIHGGYLDLSMWDAQVDELTNAGFQVIRYSDIGHGKTISGNEKLFGHEIALRLIDKLEIDKINVVGLSWGAMIATDFSLEYPEKIERLILVSPGLHGWQQYFADSLAAENYNKRIEAQEQGDTLRFIEAFQKNWTDGPRRDASRVDPQVRKKIGSMILNNLQNHPEQSRSELQLPPAIERLQKINCPVLVVKGEHDVLDIHQITELLSDKIPDVQTVEIQGAGHTLTMEKPMEFNELIIKFISN